MPIYGHFLPAAPGAEKRHDVRRKLSLLASGLLHDGTGIEVQIHNISGTGLLLESDVKLTIGDRIEIELPHAGDITAVVMWANGRHFGCQFEGPVSPAMLSAVELKSAISPPPELMDTSSPALDDHGAPEIDGATPAGVQDVIDRSRREIASAVGIDVDRIRIFVEY